MTDYRVPKKYFDNYADILVNFGLNSGEGVKSGQRVLLDIAGADNDFLDSLVKKVLQADAHPVVKYKMNLLADTFAKYGSDDQLNYVSPVEKMFFDETDLRITMEIRDFSDADPSRSKILSSARSFLMRNMVDKANVGEYTWAIGTYPTQELADYMGRPLKDMWDQLADICFLKEDNPISHWKELKLSVDKTKQALYDLDIDKLRIQSFETDLIVGLGEKRKWLGLSGRNIPSFEIFTSPDWRETNGYISFSESLSYNGKTIEGIYLEFKDGVVTKATSKTNQATLDSLIAMPGGNKLGEFSMTDKRMSRITKTMGLGIPDENIGGKYGNTHIALGFPYLDSYDGDETKLSSQEIKRLGFNAGALVHEDIITLDDRIITGYLNDGSKKIVFENGMITV